MPTDSPGNLATQLFRHRRTLRELKKEGVSRYELRDAVRSLRDARQFPADESPKMLATLIAAQLADTGLPASLNWDKIIELIEKLMPLIEMWLSMCAL